tara:strand:+ start:345 stop:911 length:567 start_codon:yes stop_codon:yes gene_type:complete
MRSIEIWKSRPNQSGSGSRGKLAKFKADYVNRVIEENGVESVYDFGCGDLHNASMIKVKDYLGIDIVEHSHPKEVGAKEFKTVVSRFDKVKFDKRADMCLCMDVLYHILEDEQDYLEKAIEKIVESSNDLIVIYAQDSHQSDNTFKYRGHLFNSPWRQIIEKKNLTLIEEQDAPQPGSSAKFFVYKKE